MTEYTDEELQAEIDAARKELEDLRNGVTPEPPVPSVQGGGTGEDFDYDSYPDETGRVMVSFEDITSYAPAEAEVVKLDTDAIPSVDKHGVPLSQAERWRAMWAGASGD